MATEVKFIEGNSTDEVTPMVDAAYVTILALSDGAIIDTKYNLVYFRNEKYYSIMIIYSYTPIIEV